MDHLRARRQTEKDQRRSAIVGASRSVFASVDLESITVDQIATACHLSRSLIYTYFLDKHHIFIALVSEALEALLGDFQGAVESGDSGLDRIFAIGWAYVSYAQSKPEHYRAIARFMQSKPMGTGSYGIKKAGLVEKFKDDSQKVSDLSARINELMACQISSGFEDGSIRKDVGDPLRAALSLWAMTSGLIQIASALESMLPRDVTQARNALIAQGLEIAREGLRNQGRKS